MSWDLSRRDVFVAHHTDPIGFEERSSDPIAGLERPRERPVVDPAYPARGAPSFLRMAEVAPAFRAAASARSAPLR